MVPLPRLALLPACALLAALLPAQPDTIVVAAAVPGPPSAILYEVDLRNGALMPLPRFPSDSFAPVALTMDPIDGTLLAGLETGNQTRIVRLRRVGSALSEAVLGSVAGRATEILVDRLGSVVVTVGGTSGGVFRVPRHGGAASTVRSQPFVTAASSPNGLAWSALLGLSGRSGPPSTDPAIGLLDLENGAFATPPIAFPGFTPRGITGVIDLPTALPRQVLAHDDGSLSLFVQQVGSVPVQVATTPALPAGGAATMKWGGSGNAVVLGDARSPRLYTFDPLTAAGGAVNLASVAAPIVGNPVDLALVPALGAETLRFAPACGSAAELVVRGIGGPPRIGNPAFAIELTSGVPQQAALLALGTDELSGVLLPNGCSVGVLPLTVVFRLTDTSGEVTQPLPVPSTTNLLGLLLFGQWFQDDGGSPFVTSQVLAIRIGS